MTFLYLAVFIPLPFSAYERSFVQAGHVSVVLSLRVHEAGFIIASYKTSVSVYQRVGLFNFRYVHRGTSSLKRGDCNNTGKPFNLYPTTVFHLPVVQLL